MTCFISSRVEDFSYIGRLYIFDTAVTGTLDVTALYDIPYSYVVIKQHMFFSSIASGTGSSKVRQKLPETVLFVSVVEIVFPRCNGRQSAEDEYAAVFCRRPAQRSGLCVRIPLLLITSYICKYSKLMSSSYINISAFIS